MRKTVLVITLVFFFEAFYGQGVYYRPIISLQYNIIVSKDASSNTTARALGSGIYDFSQKIGLAHVLPLLSKKFLAEVDFPLINIAKYRFSKNIFLSNNQLIIDTNTFHSYSQNFFSRTGSKLTLISLSIPAYIVVVIPGHKNSFFKLGIFGEYRFWGWHKLIFYQNNRLKIIHTNLHELSVNGLNLLGWGLTSGLRLKNIYIFTDLGMNDLFKIHQPNRQLTLGVYYFLSLNSLKKKTEHKTKLASYGEY